MIKHLLFIALLSVLALSRLYDRIARRRGHPKAIGAVARHLAEATYWMLSKQERYREPKGVGRFVHGG